MNVSLSFSCLISDRFSCKCQENSQWDPLALPCLSAAILGNTGLAQTTQELQGKSVLQVCKVDHGRPRGNLRTAEKHKNFKLHFHFGPTERPKRPSVMV